MEHQSNVRTVSMTTEQLQQQIARCRRLASECSLTDKDRQLLYTMANEYEALMQARSADDGMV